MNYQIANVAHAKKYSHNVRLPCISTKLMNTVTTPTALGISSPKPKVGSEVAVVKSAGPLGPNKLRDIP